MNTRQLCRYPHCPMLLVYVSCPSRPEATTQAQVKQRKFPYLPLAAARAPGSSSQIGSLTSQHAWHARGTAAQGQAQSHTWMQSVHSG